MAVCTLVPLKTRFASFCLRRNSVTVNYQASTPPVPFVVCDGLLGYYLIDIGTRKYQELLGRLPNLLESMSETLFSEGIICWHPLENVFPIGFRW